MSEHEEFAALSAAIARRIDDAPPRPKLRLITTASLPSKPARTLSDGERDQMCDDIRMYCSVYPIEPYVRRQMRGCVMPEELDDEVLREVFEFVGHCVQSIRDDVPFDLAGIL